MVMTSPARSTRDGASWLPHVTLALRAEDLKVDFAWPATRGRRLHRWLTGADLPPRDAVKFWDAANVRSMASDLGTHAAALDCGAYNSPVPLMLGAMGFTTVHSIDLNPHMTAMPLTKSVVPSCQNIVATAYADNTFDLITCCSTIEHGVDWSEFLAECARLLRPAGRLYISTDLVADDAPENDGAAFGLPWWPLRPLDLATRVQLFAEHGFVVPDLPAFTTPKRLPIEFLGQDLGFIAFETQLRAAI